MARQLFSKQTAAMAAKTDAAFREMPMLLRARDASAAMDRDLPAADNPPE
jgi:hypothetical protein